MSDEQVNWCPVTADYSAVTLPPPRDWQVRALKELREGFRAGHRCQILTAPTGAGKTVVALELLRGSLIKAKRAIFVCDRTALINQTSARADNYGFQHGVIQANHWRRDNSIPFQIASAQTIARRGYWTAADLLVVDEAHVQYKAISDWIAHTSGAVIGLTATPCTRGLGKIYHNLVNPTTMHELTVAGVLAHLKIMACRRPDMQGAETNSKGEWTERAASERETEIIGDVVGEWLAHGENRKTIAFGADIAYANELVRRFNGAGVMAIAYTSETPDDERMEIVREFEKPDSKIRVLTSVAALSRGFDVPDVGCVIDARPLRKSLSEVIQSWGRGLRSAPAKQDCLLLDFAGNTARFLPDFERVYFEGFSSLDDGERADKAVRREQEFSPKGCPKCHHTPFHRRCLACGYEKISRSTSDETAGVMTEIRFGKDRKPAATDRHELWQQIVGYVRGSKSEKKQGYAANIFRRMTGDWPPRDWHVDFTDPLEPSRQTQREIWRQLKSYRQEARGDANAPA